MKLFYRPNVTHSKRWMWNASRQSWNFLDITDCLSRNMLKLRVQYQIFWDEKCLAAMKTSKAYSTNCGKHLRLHWCFPCCKWRFFWYHGQGVQTHGVLNTWSIRISHHVHFVQPNQCLKELAYKGSWALEIQYHVAQFQYVPTEQNVFVE